MYDPLVVDTFIRVHSKIAPHQLLPAAAIKQIGTSTTQSVSSRTAPLQGDSADDEILWMPSLDAALGNQDTIVGIGETIAQHLRRVVPFSLSILYIYDVGSDELVAEHVSGEAAYLVHNLRISRGDRLTGWVAANRQTIANSDPMLDLGEISKATTPPLRTSLSVPLLVGHELLGVLTLYSATERFGDQHRRLLDAAGRQAAKNLLHLRESVVVRA
jgi:GAF domain-containing protein